MNSRFSQHEQSTNCREIKEQSSPKFARSKPNKKTQKEERLARQVWENQSARESALTLFTSLRTAEKPIHSWESSRASKTSILCTNAFVFWVLPIADALSPEIWIAPSIAANLLLLSLSPSPSLSLCLSLPFLSSFSVALSRPLSLSLTLCFSYFPLFFNYFFFYYHFFLFKKKGFDL